MMEQEHERRRTDLEVAPATPSAEAHDAVSDRRGALEAAERDAAGALPPISAADPAIASEPAPSPTRRGLGEGAHADPAQEIRDAEAHNLQHIPLVVRFDRATGGAYAKRNGQLDAARIKTWQAEHGISPADGKLTETTCAVAEGKKAPSSPSPVEPVPYPTQPDPVPYPPAPGPLPAPAPVPGFNPTLEDVMDATWSSMQFTMLAKRDGLARLASELKSSDPHAHDPGEEMLKEGATESLTKSVEELGHLEHASAVTQVIFAGWIGAFMGPIVGQAIDAVKKIFVPDKKHPPPGAYVDLFVQGQVRAATDAAHRQQQLFLREGKSRYRAMEAEQRDAGVEQALVDLAAWEAAREQAELSQHDHALHQWTVMLAHSELGVDEEKSYPFRDDATRIKDFKKLREARGVLRLEVEGTTPANGFHVKSATIAGLPEAARVQFEDKTIDEMNLPVHATAKVSNPAEGGDPIGLRLVAGEELSQTVGDQTIREQKTDWEAAAGDGVESRRWLAKKANPGAVIATKEDADAGARKALLEDLGPRKPPPIGG